MSSRKTAAKDYTPPLSAPEAIAREFTEVMSTPMTGTRERFLREVLAVTRAAAVGGEYRDALKGYELIGKSLGHITETQQHLHLHAAPSGNLAECSDEELTRLMEAPPPTPAAPPSSAEPTQAEIEAFAAEIEALAAELMPA